ncbi:MAG: hypothetical protein RSD27_11495, partial [Ruthenibacterium sp.]
MTKEAEILAERVKSPPLLFRCVTAAGEYTASQGAAPKTAHGANRISLSLLDCSRACLKTRCVWIFSQN